MATVTFKVFVDLALTNDATEALGFRYSLFGNPTTTEALHPAVVADSADAAVAEGSAEGGEEPLMALDQTGWTRISAPGEDEAAAEANAQEEVEEGMGHLSEELSGMFADDEGAEKVPPALFRWECSHDVAVDDAFVLALNQDPLCPFFVYRGGATAAPPPPLELEQPPSRPGSKGKDAPPDAPPVTTAGVVHYHHATVLDLSVLLAGRLSCSLAFGAHPTADAWAAHLEDSQGAAGSDWLASLLHARNKCAFAPPPGVAYARVSVVVAKDGLPLLSRAELDRFNPLSVTVCSARDLPGVRLEAAPLKHYTHSSPFALQHTHCAPTYAVLQPLVPSLGPRLVATEGQVAGREAVWELATCFLTGRDVVDRHVLEAAVEGTPLRVEVHDRDPIASGHDLRLARYERLARGEEALGGPATEAAADEGPLAAAEGGAEGEAAAGMDVFEVDKVWLVETVAAWARAGDAFSHGTSSFQLNGLLDQAAPLAAAFARTKTRRRQPVPSLTLKLREPVLPSKRRVAPKGGEDDWALLESERLVRQPGHYLATDASLRVKVRLHRPLRTLCEHGGEFAGAATLAPRPFGRAVFVFEYENAPLLHAVSAAMDAANTSALGDAIQGSLRSHQLSAEQAASAMSGHLDVVCGFQIIDDDCRMIVVEGLAAAVNRLLDAVPREAANDPATRVLSNPSVAFHARLYTAFHVDLKKIKLRDSLPLLVERPEIYNHAKVSPACFEALHKLRACRNANRLAELASQGLFPLDEQLLQIESKYGESISMEDIDGVKVVKKKPRVAAHAAQAQAAGGAPTPPGTEDSNALTMPLSPSEGGGGAAAAALLATMVPGDGTGGHGAAAVRRKAATDATNPAFEASKRDYAPPDFLTAQRDALEESLAEFEVARAAAAAARAADPVPAKFVYSGQKLQYTELKKGEMRAKLGREKNTHFTYAQGYLAAAVSMVDAPRLKLDQELESRARWKTKRGFVYPAPKPVAEFAAHPRKPSTSRVDELREPWVENERHPLPVGRGGGLQAGQPDFDTIPAHGAALFGGLHAPTYARPYDNKNVGSEQRLPRGGMALSANPDFFRSVHLTGAGLAEEKRAQKAAEEAAWRAKVVVDHLDFKVGGFKIRDRPLQTSKTDDILKGPALSKPLLIVRNAKLPSGKKVPLRALPISAFSAEPYADPRDFTADLRPDDFETFLATDSAGKHLDFVTAIHKEVNYPKSQCAVSRRSIPPMSQSEKAGARWANQG